MTREERAVARRGVGGGAAGAPANVAYDDSASMDNGSETSKSSGDDLAAGDNAGSDAEW